jgi:hypothetical protein
LHKRSFDKRALRGIFGHKQREREERGEWGKLHND